MVLNWYLSEKAFHELILLLINFFKFWIFSSKLMFEKFLFLLKVELDGINKERKENISK